MEIVITPATTHILISHIHDNRRIFTDGRAWPKEIEPTFSGYSIGTWLDTDGDGRYDTLEVETRAIKGPRAYDAGGPAAACRQQDRRQGEASISTRPIAWSCCDEITTIDNALTRPWTVEKEVHPRRRTRGRIGSRRSAPENNPHVTHPGRQLFHRRGRAPDAVQEGPGSPRI